MKCDIHIRVEDFNPVHRLYTIKYIDFDGERIRDLKHLDRTELARLWYLFTDIKNDIDFLTDTEAMDEKSSCKKQKRQKDFS